MWAYWDVKNREAEVRLHRVFKAPLAHAPNCRRICGTDEKLKFRLVLRTRRNLRFSSYPRSNSICNLILTKYQGNTTCFGVNWYFSASHNRDPHTIYNHKIQDDAGFCAYTGSFGVIPKHKTETGLGDCSNGSQLVNRRTGRPGCWLPVEGVQVSTCRPRCLNKKGGIISRRGAKMKKTNVSKCIIMRASRTFQPSRFVRESPANTQVTRHRPSAVVSSKA